MNLFRTHVQSSHDLDSHAQYSHEPSHTSQLVSSNRMTRDSSHENSYRLTRDCFCMTHDSLQNTYTVKTLTVSRAESSHQNACQYME